MPDALGVRNLLDAIVPISRFNLGEAGHIFAEVKRKGAKKRFQKT